MTLRVPDERQTAFRREVVAATLIRWAVLGELVDPMTTAGLVIIFVGFACIKRRALSDLAASVP
ncbi:hypothetical protein [Halorussus aquaticus]|uniref:Uncharacterized protein n=1 Tax=Halorussus aquaticus TaxID=2953748 RepID=A0ABD5Q6M8_9EURY|nr:hypothetical protein [Halorussus aquaticus]